MKTPLRVLIIEDSEDDALLLAREIKKNNYDVTFRRVDTSDAMSEALNQQKWDIIISDYEMPHFSVSEALELLRNSGLDLPFIIVSGVIGEEAAVNSLKAGAHDFIMKSNFSRLIPAIKRELNEAEVRRSKRIAEKKLKHLNLVLRAIRSVNQLIIREKDRDRLLKSTCENLIENREYYNAWIILLDESGEFLRHAEAGLGKDFLPMVAQLKRGDLPTCCLQALRQEGVVSIKDPSSTCSDCPLAKKFPLRGALAVPLKSNEKVYGLLVTSVPTELVDDEEEKSLFQEVAGDIAFALYSIELGENRKQAEKTLRESKQRYQDLFDSTYDMIQSVTPDGHFVFVNKAWQETLGYTEAELSGLNIFKIIDPESLSHCQEIFSKVIAGESVRNVQATFVAKDGRLIQVEGNAIPRFSGGRVIATQGFFRDITERKKAEDAIKRAAEEWRVTFDSITDLVSIHDKDFRLVRVNKAFADIFNMKPEELVGKTCYQVVHGTNECVPHCPHMKTLETREPAMED
ncbi:MAG: PAS domain S-box protein, partial [Candidatus Bathyarchaeota archaeon]|nr:PAS domain S-box protein [Candidatus Bathyarchaeota archaeon]